VDQALSPIEATSEVGQWDQSSLVDEGEAVIDSNPVVEEDIHPIMQQGMKFGFQNHKFIAYKQPLSRHERARLAAAGFERPLDAKSRVIKSTPASQLDADKIIIDSELEWTDTASINNISIQFMAVSFKPSTQRLMYPTNVYFTFQFYTFPYATTGRVSVYTGPLPPQGRNEMHGRSISVPSSQHTRSASRQSLATPLHAPADSEFVWPGILYGLGDDGEANCMLLLN
jgi:hypothetical protein